MKVQIHMHGNLRRFMADGAERAVLEVATGTTVADLLVSLGAAADVWLVAVNGAAVERDRVLGPDDHVDCFEPVAGG
jgi:sulfur carrier protein ThiS